MGILGKKKKKVEELPVDADVEQPVVSEKEQVKEEPDVKVSPWVQACVKHFNEEYAGTFKESATNDLLWALYCEIMKLSDYLEEDTK